MSRFRTLDDLCEDYRDSEALVLVRADLNVPLDENGNVRDATRLSRLLPTLNKLTEAKFRVGVLSHFSRPEGKRNPEMSLRPIAKALKGMIDVSVNFAADCIGEPRTTALAKTPAGGVCVLENTRFYLGEEANDMGFATDLVKGAVAYVNDAFSVAHRAHASVEAITHILPAYCGAAMQAELTALDAALTNPKKPVVALVGGAKISTKITILENLSKRVDTLIIGGAMANTFLAAQGFSVGTSLYEKDMLGIAKKVLANAPCEILLPSDVVIADALLGAETAGQETRIVSAQAVPDDKMILDVGTKSVEAIGQIFANAATLIWNGPLGAFETPPFDETTNLAAQKAADLTKQGNLTSIAGGGDTVAALNHAGVSDDFTYISTAGGAFLEWLEGKTLPGIAALEK